MWPPEEEFADRLARLRRARPYSNAEIAAACGLKNSNTVSNWNSGQTPEGMVLVRLAELFDVSVRWLLTGREADPADVRSAPVDEPPVFEPARVSGKHTPTPKPPKKASRKKGA